MSENDDSSRWPDLKIASSLWSLLGSQPSNEQEKAALEGAEAIAQLRSNRAPPQHDTRAGESSTANANPPDATAVMADTQGRSMDGLTDFNGYVEGGEGGQEADTDFGALEMFDSNSLQAPFSSSVAANADDAAQGSSRKSKRDKKKKKNPETEEGERGSKKSARQEAKSSAAAQEAEDEHAVDDQADEADTTRSKKKRKHSDSDHHKRRKRRRSPAGGDEQEDAQASAHDAGAEAGAAPAPDTNMDTGEADLNGQPEQPEEPAMSSRDVAALAREAWNDMGGEAGEATGEQAYADASEHRDVYDAPESTFAAEPPSSSKKKSRGKKAKPTFFEQPPEPEADDTLDALGNLPSPSAMTPKPRNRSKKSSRASKSRSKQKLSQSMRGGSQEQDEEGGRKRSRSMAGFTQGRFTDAEMDKITHVLEMFKKEHDLEQRDINEMIQTPGGTTAGDLHAEMWTRIFEENPQRHRQKVINTCRKRFHNFVARGTWTIEQDAELAALIESHGQKWSKIGGLINRHPEDIRDRYRNYLVCGSNQRKDTWDEQEEQRLMQYVIEAMEAIDELRRIQPSRELLKKPYEELIDWQNISERMDRTRSRLQCITKWKAMNLKTNGRDQLESTNPDTGMSFRLEKARRQLLHMPDEERFRLVLAIQATGAGTEAKVPWQRLVDKQFRNSWHRTAQVLLWRRLRSTLPGQENKSVRDVAKELIDQYNSTGGFPSLPDEHFDVQDEMQFMSSLPASGAPTNGRGRRGRASTQNISQEFAMESDEDATADDTAARAAEAVAAAAAAQPILQGDSMAAPEATMTSDIQIDPALAAATQQLTLPEAEQGPTSGSSKKAKKSGSRKKSKKDAGRDTPEIIEKLASLAQQAGADADEAQVAESSKAADGTTGTGDGAESGSEMNDMEDLPAKLPTQVQEAF